MSGSKRRGVFERIHALEEQDLQVFKRKKSDRQRSLAAQSQHQVYQKLVECRILLQRSLDKPEPDDAIVGQCDNVLKKLLRARSSLSRQQKANDDDDEEDMVLDRSSIEDRLTTEYSVHRETWKEVLDRRHKDARLHAGTTQKFRVLDASFFEQVESIVQHEEMKQRQSKDAIASFDDAKVYQQLLKDFLSQQSSTSGSSSSQLLAHSSKKAKKKVVDRKASKGRKIRYTEIPKLVHFTFPIARPETDLDTNTWLRSLFGGAIHRATTTTKKADEGEDE